MVITQVITLPLVFGTLPVVVRAAGPVMPTRRRPAPLGFIKVGIKPEAELVAAEAILG